MAGRFRRDGPISVVGSVSMGHFLSHVYLLAFPPLFPLLGSYFSLTTTQLGLLVTAIYIPTLILQLPLGIMVDRIGAKRVLVGGLLLTALAITAAGFAPTYQLLLLCAFLSGIGQSVFHPADYAFLDAVTDERTEGKAFSAHTFGGYAGFAAAPAAIGGIAIAIDWRTALVAVGVVGMVYAIIFAIWTPAVYANTRTSADVTPSLQDTLRLMAGYIHDRDLLGVAVFYFISMTAVVGLQSFTTVLGVETYGFSESAANSLLTAHLAAVSIGVLLGGPIADRIHFRPIITSAFVLSALGVWVAAIGPWDASFIAPLLVFVIVGLVLGGALPARDQLANSIGDPNATGARFGFFFTGVSLGAVIAPVVLGYIIDRWSEPLAFVVVGVSFACGAVLVFWITSGPSRHA